MSTLKANSVFPQITNEELDLIQSQLVLSVLTEEEENAIQGGNALEDVIAVVGQGILNFGGTPKVTRGVGGTK
ncbi:hypothetical protein H6G96_33625 [Nostoc sp. FACHB-892]|uniref:hypothetical protein n=1 Tax=Nostoc sp. FACHB-892 TaxID=2692843 RepID=UPI00168727C8|nr:hypothetical protein [Nostoc sp. FACHB-892]MBD2731125.1 hypothetical protein [Nostoc sp. FACHB-892]